MYGRDTFLVESFNNVALIYLDKRIHYRDEIETFRRNFAVIDWNEHVSRPYTSSSNCLTVRHLLKESEKRACNSKTFNFINKIWQAFTATLGLPDSEISDAD